VPLAARKVSEEIAAELGVSAATLYNGRRRCGCVDTGVAKELKELREQNAWLKRLLADAELDKKRIAGRRRSDGTSRGHCRRRPKGASQGPHDDREDSGEVVAGVVRSPSAQS
jgi:hypothetical protein